MKFLLLFLFLLTPVLGQTSSMEDEITTAHLNAKKGIQYGLKNLKDKRAKFDHKLIDKSKLISTVKVSKEINGVKVEATGYYLSTEVSIVIYRSYLDLVKDGYIKDASDYPIENLEELTN